MRWLMPNDHGRSATGCPAGTRVRRTAARLSPSARLTVKLAALLVLVIMPPAWGAAWRGRCDVHFHGTSSLHDFTGSVPCQPFRVGLDDGGGGKTVIRGADVSVLTVEMNTGNKRRDGQMREMFQSDRFPAIRGSFGKIDPDTLRQELRRRPDGKAPLDFVLRIRDVERPVHGVLSNLRETGRALAFDVDYDVSLSDFRLVAPKAFFGMVKVGDKVAVKTTVRLDTDEGH